MHVPLWFIMWMNSVDPDQLASIAVSWLQQKPADLDPHNPHCFQNRIHTFYFTRIFLWIFMKNIVKLANQTPKFILLIPLARIPASALGVWVLKISLIYIQVNDITIMVTFWLSFSGQQKTISRFSVALDPLVEPKRRHWLCFEGHLTVLE